MKSRTPYDLLGQVMRWFIEKCGKTSFSRLIPEFARRKYGGLLGWADRRHTKIVANRSMNLKRRIAERVTENTILISSFPRTGNGWTRYILSTVLNYKRTGLVKKLSQAEMYKYVPTIHGMEDIFPPYKFGNGHYLLKTHWTYQPEYNNAIVLCRDPYSTILRIVVRSLYSMLSKEVNDSINSLVHEIVREFFLEKAYEYIKFYEEWLVALNRNSGGFRTRHLHQNLNRENREKYLLFKYENAISNPLSHFRTMCDFLRITPPENILEEILSLYDRKTVLLHGAKDLYSEEKYQTGIRFMEMLAPLITSDALEQIDAECKIQLDNIVGRLDQAAITTLKDRIL